MMRRQTLLLCDTATWPVNRSVSRDICNRKPVFVQAAGQCWHFTAVAQQEPRPLHEHVCGRRVKVVGWERSRWGTQQFAGQQTFGFGREKRVPRRLCLRRTPYCSCPSGPVSTSTFSTVALPHRGQNSLPTSCA